MPTVLLLQADFSSSSAAPEPQPGDASATPPDWSSFGAPAPQQLQMQPYSTGITAQPPPQQQQMPQQMPPWGAPLQLEAPPSQPAAQREGAPAGGADWFDFGGGPPAGASGAASGSSSSTALVPVGGVHIMTTAHVPRRMYCVVLLVRILNMCGAAGSHASGCTQVGSWQAQCSRPADRRRLRGGPALTTHPSPRRRRLQLPCLPALLVAVTLGAHCCQGLLESTTIDMPMSATFQFIVTELRPYYWTPVNG